MKVLKFGGTSVGSVNSILQVKKIVESIPGSSITVVSALGGVTDKLILCANLAANGDKTYIQEWEGLVARHREMINEVVRPENKKKVGEETEALLKDLLKILEGVELIGTLPEKTLALIVSFGENISSRIVAGMIEGAERHDSLNFIKTEKWHGKNIADRGLTESLIKAEFENFNGTAIVPGFISRDKDNGEITNLGRGGSDYTGALIAAALDAEVLEIWTDVDGFMTADPRIIKNAIVIDHLTFTESMELCTFGAKVIYPPTIYPVFHKNIPIKILNTFNPEAKGTLITDISLDEDLPIKGVSPLRHTAIVKLFFSEPREDDKFNRRALNTLAKNGVRIFPLVNAEPSLYFSFGVEMAELERVAEALSIEFAPEFSSGDIFTPEIHKDLTVIAVVGTAVKNDSRLQARIVNSLVRESITVYAMSSATSETTHTYLVEDGRANEAMGIIHDMIF